MEWIISTHHPCWKKIIFCICTCLFFAQSLYLYTSGTHIKTSVPLTPEVAAGFDLYQQNNCSACHQIYGLGGYMGPDLTNVISLQGKGRAYVTAFIQYGTARMPAFQFSQNEVNNLIKFLEYVDASGEFPVKNAKASWNGTVQYYNTPEY